MQRILGRNWCAEAQQQYIKPPFYVSYFSIWLTSLLYISFHTHHTDCALSASSGCQLSTPKTPLSCYLSVIISSCLQPLHPP
jgi:hypothetical protein